MAVHPVQFLAACQAPGPAYHLVAPVADPEPGWALLAVDAELQGAQRPLGAIIAGGFQAAGLRVASPCCWWDGSLSAAIRKQ